MNSGRRFTLDRLRGRSWREVRVRASQFAAVVLERSGILDQGELSASALHRRLAPATRARHDTMTSWVRELRARDGRHFFAGCNDPQATARLATTHDPDGMRRVMRRATQALEGRLDLLGYGEMAVGNPIQWHRDPVSGITAPDEHWSRVPYLDPRVAGDHKRVWEVNRHQWLVSLGQAWAQSGDERFAAFVDTTLQSWMDANPPTRGINWASSLEIGFRSMAWLWTLRLLGRATALRDETVARAIGHLVLAARHIVRNLSTYFSPNTHLTGEALALYLLGCELEDLTESAHWRDVGRSVLLAELPRHVRPDGTYFEQSTWYLRYTLDFYVHFALLAEQRGETMPQVCDAVRRLGEVLASITRSDGTFPLIGDDDGGRLLFLDGRPGMDARPALAVAGALAKSNWLLSRAEGAVGDLAWLLGHVPALQEPPVLPNGSKLFADGGLAVMRSGWGAEATVLTVDAGPHGALNCGHAHADSLSLDLTLRGIPLFADPGTCSYSPDDGLREHYRATKSHNAATLDGRSSSVTAGAFAWSRIAATTLEGWCSGAWGAWLRGSHDGYGVANGANAYGRDVHLIGDGIVIIRDQLRGASGVLATHLQCSEGSRVMGRGDSGQLMVERDGKVVAEVFVPDAAVQVVVADGTVAPAYGAARAAPRIEISAAMGPVAAVHVVIAAPGMLRGVRWISGTAGQCLALSGADSGRDHLAGYGLFHSDVMHTSIDATAWWLQLNDTGQSAAHWMVCRGRSLRVGETAVLDSPTPIDAWGPPPGGR